MSKIKSFSVGNGDMFYIEHNSPNFTIIDCCLSDENKDRIIADIHHAHLGKEITRFISTHPDQDHIQGLKYLDDNLDILNFYCVKNNTTKKDETEDFKHYKKLHDSGKAFYIEKGVTRKWMNLSSDERGASGLHFLWPNRNNSFFIEALKIAENGGSPNNISAILRYALDMGLTAVWMGDLETEFMKNIENDVDWPKTDVLFAPHHGRSSGKVPESILKKMNPKVIILGEAPSEDLDYYKNYNTITQNSAGDIILECGIGVVNFYVGNENYRVNFLENNYLDDNEDGSYIGTLEI